MARQQQMLKQQVRNFITCGIFAIFVVGQCLGFVGKKKVSWKWIFFEWAIIQNYAYHCDTSFFVFIECKLCFSRKLLDIFVYRTMTPANHLLKSLWSLFETTLLAMFSFSTVSIKMEFGSHSTFRIGLIPHLCFSFFFLFYLIRCYLCLCLLNQCSYRI